MAMHLKLADAGPGGMPDFMALLRRSDELPGWWEPFASAVVTLLAILVLPALVAVRARLRDLQAPGQGRLLRDPHPGAGRGVRDPAHRPADQRPAASTGLNNFRGFFGYNLDDPVNKQMLYFIAAGVLLVVVAAGPPAHA